MAQVTTTGLAPTNPGGSIREDLINFITTISREETPFLSSIGSTTATNVVHDWLTDDLRTPDDTNAASEGAAYAAGSVNFTNRVRKQNVCQIFRAELGTSGTADAVDAAGVGSSEYAYQLKKNAKELKRSIERQYVRFEDFNTVAPTNTVKTTTDPRRTGSIFTWVHTVYRAPTAGNIAADDNAGNGTNLTFTANQAGAARVANDQLNGDRVVRPVAALTNVSLTRGHVEGMLAAMYEDGTRPNMAMTSPTLKVRLSSVFSDANSSSAAQRRMTSMEQKLNIAVTAVMTDFGFDIALVPNYQMGSSSVSAGFDNGILFYESGHINRAFLRNYTHKDLDDQGDGKRGIILCEEALEVRNPKAVGAIYGVM